MSDKEMQIFIERMAHDIISPLSSVCMIAEMLDETLYKQTMRVITVVNLIKTSFQENTSVASLRKFHILFHNITSDSDHLALKHLLIWLYFKQMKNTVIKITNETLYIDNIMISDEEKILLNCSDLSKIESLHHTVYLKRFLLNLKKWTYTCENNTLDMKMNVSTLDLNA